VTFSFFSRVKKKLSNAKVGDRIRIRGIVVPRDRIESPLTGEPCVYYNYKILQTSSLGDHSAAFGFPLDPGNTWNLIKNDEAICEFYLLVDKSRIVIAPENVTIITSSAFRAQDVPFHIVGQKASELLIQEGDIVEVEGELFETEDMALEMRDYRSTPRTKTIRSTDQKIWLVSRRA